MNREGMYCSWPPCGVVNPKQSHWHIGNKRFCCGEHYRLYADADVEEKEHEINGTSLPRMPSHGVWGRSPR